MLDDLEFSAEELGRWLDNPSSSAEVSATLLPSCNKVVGQLLEPSRCEQLTNRFSESSLSTSDETRDSAVDFDVSEVVHAIQNERGTSCGWVASQVDRAA